MASAGCMREARIAAACRNVAIAQLRLDLDVPTSAIPALVTGVSYGRPLHPRLTRSPNEEVKLKAI